MFHNFKGINIYYERFGSGIPIIFLHGWGCSLDVFKQTASTLKNKYEVFLIDLPGFGKSSNIEIPLDVKEVTTIIKDFIEKNSIINPILIGHSYGGRILIEYASSSTNISKLILIDSAGIKHKSLKKWIKIKLYKLKKYYFKLILWLRQRKKEAKYLAKKLQEEEAARAASSGDFLDDFFRDMQNGTLNQVKIEQEKNPEPEDKASESNNTDNSNG